MPTMTKEQREIHDKLCKKLIDEGKLIEAGFQGLLLAVIPENASQIQIEEMRIAFFSGAQHLFGAIMSSLDEDEEPTEEDMQRMANISEELDRFANYLELRARQAPPGKH